MKGRRSVKFVSLSLSPVFRASDRCFPSVSSELYSRYRLHVHSQNDRERERDKDVLDSSRQIKLRNELEKIIIFF